MAGLAGVQFAAGRDLRCTAWNLHMAYSEELAERLRASLVSKSVAYEEKKMMGGLCFMVDGKMCVGVTNDDLMVRLDPEVYEDALEKTGCRPMDFTGRPMKGFVFVDESGMKGKAALSYWVDLALDFNPRARSSKKK